MPDQPNDKKLSEIGHLFLSSIRERAANGAAPPRRTPPPKRDDISIDLTPEEFAQVVGDVPLAPAPAPAARPAPDITAVIATHLNGRQLDRVREYARHLTAGGARIGLIEVDASEFRLMTFDSTRPSDQAARAETETFDPRRMSEALTELSGEVDRWLLLLPTPRLPEGRAILREVSRLVALCTCDHDGLVACYRTLKGVSDLWPGTGRPQLSLALLDAMDDQHAERISAKLATVCRQFLAWPLDSEAYVRPAPDSAEHLALCCRPMHDKAQVAAAPQWEIAREFILRSRSAKPEAHDMSDQNKAAVSPGSSEAPRRMIAELVVPTPSATAPAAAPPAARATTAESADRATVSDVIELPSDASDLAIVCAVLQHRAGELIECPLSPPNFPSARLAVARDHRIILFALAHQGLGELPTIGQAYDWLLENRSLIGMAMPQLAIDAKQTPQLSLLVDRTDCTAQRLQSIVQNGRVTVQTYRRLRLGDKTGLLLEAA